MRHPPRVPAEQACRSRGSTAWLWLNGPKCCSRVCYVITRLRRIQPHLGRAHAICHTAKQRSNSPINIFSPAGSRYSRLRRRAVAPVACGTTTVAYIRCDNGYAVEGLNLGSDHDPSWCLNLRVDHRPGSRWQAVALQLPTSKTEELRSVDLCDPPRVSEAARRSASSTVAGPS